MLPFLSARCAFKQNLSTRCNLILKLFWGHRLRATKGLESVGTHTETYFCFSGFLHLFSLSDFRSFHMFMSLRLRQSHCVTDYRDSDCACANEPAAGPRRSGVAISKLQDSSFCFLFPSCLARWVAHKRLKFVKVVVRLPQTAAHFDVCRNALAMRWSESM